MRLVYVNGVLVPDDEAHVSIFDRGFLFSDSVYEVTACLEGRLIDNDAHLNRLFRSLGELRINLPMSREGIRRIQNDLLVRNGVTEGIVYIQVSRGAADRNFTWPDDISPNVVVFTQAKDLRCPPLAERGARILTVPDIRWKRRDIKTTSLLAQSMAKAEAVRAGYDDAWMVEEGFITEGSSTNAFIVTAGGKLVTRKLSAEILSGVTRRAVLDIAASLDLEIEERAFSVSEAQAAHEAFATGSSFFVLPVVEIDTVKIGAGKPGQTSKNLRKRYIELALAAE